MDSHRQPLIDLRLFESKGFTWGTLLATLITFAMFGLLFTIPQYFQTVESRSVLQAGLHLLPMIGGLIIAGGIGAKFGRKLGASKTAALGYFVLACGLVLGSRTTLTSSNTFSIVWVAIVGAGLGFVMPTVVNAALGALKPERSGVGSSLNQAIRQVGSTLGVAVLGSVIGASYRSKLHLAGLSASAQAVVKSGVTSGAEVAHKFNNPALFQQVRLAFIHGMHNMLLVCTAVAIVGIFASLKFLPSKSSTIKS